MQVIHSKQALISPPSHEQGTPRWVPDVRLHINGGQITHLETAATPKSGDTRVDSLLPALSNLHSHSFQRAMAGMTEYRAAGQESFWTWRRLMYRFLDQLTPDHIEAIAALVFLEMQEAGYSAVGEFHYVHHSPGGKPYDRRDELSQRIFAAAQETGIGLCHLPVLYTYGGVNQQPLQGGQLRFSNTLDQYQDLLGACHDSLQYMPSDTALGVAPHSLRATTPADLSGLLAAQHSGPVHIHIAEQTQEVADVIAKLGARPVEWLLDNAPVDQGWCLIHATHMSSAETTALAQTGAVAGLCPITEANLGDGIFNGATYLQAGGTFGVGSDSNIHIALGEELRTLEYSQRLRDQERNVLAPAQGSTGQTLYLGAATGGARALGRHSGRIAVGYLADLVAVDRSNVALCALKPEQLIDGMVFAAGAQVITDLWSAGRHCVKDGQHIHRAEILSRYRAAISSLLSTL